MVRKLLDKQWNRQNSILFRETIPLNTLKVGEGVNQRSEAKTK
jgi:hypothetical protein